MSYFVEISHPARFCIQISYPTILLFYNANRIYKSWVVYRLCLSAGNEQSAHISVRFSAGHTRSRPFAGHPTNSHKLKQTYCVNMWYRYSLIFWYRYSFIFLSHIDQSHSVQMAWNAQLLYSYRMYIYKYLSCNCHLMDMSYMKFSVMNVLFYHNFSLEILIRFLLPDVATFSIGRPESYDMNPTTEKMTNPAKMLELQLSRAIMMPSLKLSKENQIRSLDFPSCKQEYAYRMDAFDIILYLNVKFQIQLHVYTRVSNNLWNFQT